GVQQLVEALLARLPRESLRAGNAATALQRAPGGWQVKTSGASEIFDAVLLAVPAPTSAGLLSTIDLEIAGHLEKIQYTSSVAVALAYPRVELPPGFGFLVPRSEGRKLMACTFVHNKFSGRAPEGAALIRCFFSNSRVPDLMDHSDDELKRVARQELKDILGLDAQPQFSCAFRWRQA